MGIFDSVKGLAGDHKKEVKSGVDAVADAVEAKTPDQLDDKVEAAGEAIKDQVDKLDG